MTGLALPASGGAVAISVCRHTTLAFALPARRVSAACRRIRRGVVLGGPGFKLLPDA